MGWGQIKGSLKELVKELHVLKKTSTAESIQSLYSRSEGKLPYVIQDSLIERLKELYMNLEGVPGQNYQRNQIEHYLTEGKKLNEDFLNIYKSTRRGANPINVYPQTYEIAERANDYMLDIATFTRDNFGGGKIEITGYPKIYRIPIGPRIIGKDYMTRDQAEKLLSGEVVIEEKIDGSTDSRDFGDHKVFGEAMKNKHSIPYDELPGYFIGFDVWDKKDGKFLGYDSKIEFLRKHGIPSTNLIFRGTHDPKDLEGLTKYLGKSKFAADQDAEGIVIKNYDTQMFGKLVRLEFLEGITDHWIDKKREFNKLKQA